jgi:pimeloyl-ACP methyl ester carboxylesterase
LGAILAILTGDNARDHMSLDGRWFGSGDRPSLGWLSLSSERISDSGVVILPPVGYAYWCSHRTLRVLAQRLAAQGHSVLRVDYDGTGDAAGDQWEPDRVAAWRRSARAAVDELRTLGCVKLTVIGVRLGATFALLDGASLEVDRVVGWAPVVSGRRYAKELRLLSTPVPPGTDPLEPPGTIVTAGNVFSIQTLNELAGLSLAGLDRPPARRTLIVEGPGGPAAATAEQLTGLRADVRYVQLAGGEAALETPPEFAAVPEAILAEICAWLGCAERGAHAPPEPRASARLAWGGGEVDEHVVTLEPHRHLGVECEPPEPDPSRPTLVLLNPGSETHVGPGRAWVEFARGLARRGHRSVRVDFRGWGESPDEGRAPGRPYDPSAIDDTAAIVRSLHDHGHERVVLFGLCASAWIALRAVLEVPVDGVIALNPQMYWRQGDPVEIDWDVIRARRAKEIERISLGARLRAWSLLDAIGQRSAAGRWLDALAATGVPITLLFAEGDDGLRFLRERLSRRLAAAQRTSPIAVRELPGVDHPLHRAWARAAVIEALDEALRGTTPGPTPNGAATTVASVPRSPSQATC